MNSLLLKWNCTSVFLMNCHVMLRLLAAKLFPLSCVSAQLNPETEGHPPARKVCGVWGGFVGRRHSQQVLYTITVSHGGSTSPFLLPTLHILHPLGKSV